VSRDPRDNLGIALDHLAVLDRHLATGRIDSAMTFDAVCMRLSAAIEVVARLPEPWLAAESGDEWPRIRATRNLIAHDYRSVDPARIRQVLEHRLGRFTTGVRHLVDRHAPGLEPELR
jgi:uncharacterized protein with HEPN domain